MNKKNKGKKQEKDAANAASKGSPKPVNNLKNVFNLLIVLVVSLGVVYGVARVVLWRERKAVEVIEASNTKTVGVIVKVGSMKGSYAVAEYTVNGKVYQRRNSSPANDIYVGEYYEVIYDARDPAESRIDYTKPIFIKDQKIGITVGTIVSKSFAVVGFRYRVNGEDIKRWQKCSDVDSINIGNTYTVEYLLSNPRIAILKTK